MKHQHIILLADNSCWPQYFPWCLSLKISTWGLLVLEREHLVIVGYSLAIRELKKTCELTSILSETLDFFYPVMQWYWHLKESLQSDQIVQLVWCTRG